MHTFLLSSREYGPNFVYGTFCFSMVTHLSHNVDHYCLTSVT